MLCKPAVAPLSRSLLYIQVDIEAVIHLPGLGGTAVDYNIIIVHQGNNHPVLSWLHDPMALKVTGVTTVGVNARAATGEQAIVVSSDPVLEKIRLPSHTIGQGLAGCTIA